MSQHEMIRRYIEKNGSITPMQAFMELGITKLSTRIGEMIQSGQKITKAMEVGQNRFGDPVRYMRYYKEA